MKRQWIKTKDKIPEEGQKVYYFCDFLGIFRGEYHLEETRVAIGISPHTFISNHGKLDSDEVTYWMPYDHSLRDMIPLPPDYYKVDLSMVDTIIDEVPLLEQQRVFNFTYETAGDI